MRNRALVVVTLALLGCVPQVTYVKTYSVVTVAFPSGMAINVACLQAAIGDWNDAIGVKHFKYAADGADITCELATHSASGLAVYYNPATKHIAVLPGVSGRDQIVALEQGLGASMGLKTAESPTSIMYPDVTAAPDRPSANDTRWAKANLGID